MKSAVTVSLVPEARGGPFVFWDHLSVACGKAAELGFAAIELFPSSAVPVTEAVVSALLSEHRLLLAAVGTGAGWVQHQLTLTSPDESVRRRAREFAMSIVDAAGRLHAPAIIGSMQGRAAASISRDRAWDLLRTELDVLGDRAKQYGVPLLYEPLNRYETNLVNTIEAGVELLRTLKTNNVKLLADLFHMNVEEKDLPAALRAGGKHIGHVHLADSNRRPPGFGHTDLACIATALREIGYEGFISAECFPYPDSDAAASHVIHAFNRHFR